jgi:hypothetical protein
MTLGTSKKLNQSFDFQFDYPSWRMARITNLGKVEVNFKCKEEYQAVVNMLRKWGYKVMELTEQNNDFADIIGYTFQW